MDEKSAIYSMAQWLALQNPLTDTSSTMVNWKNIFHCVIFFLALRCIDLVPVIFLIPWWFLFLSWFFLIKIFVDVPLQFSFSPCVSPFIPKALTSFRLSGLASPLSIWTMTYLPDKAWPEILIRNIHLTTKQSYLWWLYVARLCQVQQSGQGENLRRTSGWQM